MSIGTPYHMSERGERSTIPSGVTTDTATSFGFTIGTSHTQSSWSDFRRMTWPQLVEMLTSHVPGQKEGSCIVPAQFSGSRRHKDDAARIDVAFLDSDSGSTLAEIELALVRCGWEAVVSSTHSHMSTRTKVKISNWDRFFANNPQACPEDFLIHDKGYLPSVAKGAEAGDTDGDYVYVEHSPCPKFRIAIPLDRPWLASEYPSQAAASAAWKERIEALAGALNLDHDQACTDTSRLFYLPRRPANGVVPETAVVAGSHCNIFALARAAVEPDDLLSSSPRVKPPQADSGRPEYIDPVEGEVIDLVDWAKEFGGRFLIAKALKSRKAGVLTGHDADGKVHIECPNEHAHTQAGRDGATYVINAGQSATKGKGFVVHCMHAHCVDKDRVGFVKQMLEANWISPDDLKDPRFLRPKEDEAKDAPAKEPRNDVGLPLLWFDEIEPVLDARDFVQGVLLEQGAVVVYGESNAGKTFWATDLALHVAAGEPWCGKRVEQGGVVYCVLEGGIGFRNRVSAWKFDRRMDGQSMPFAAIPSGLNLLDPDADTPRLIAAIEGAKAKMTMPVKLIVIDTLSRAMAGGNENAPDDMGALVQNMDTIRAETGACVMFIHHSGKDAAKGARGHSLLRAAIDTEIEVVAEVGSEAKTATVVKQRELKKGDGFAFTLKVVELGSNRHDEKVTTCLVDYGENQAPGGAPDRSRRLTRNLTGHTKRAFEVLIDLVAADGKSGHPGTPPGILSVPEKWWRERFYERGMPDGEYQAKKKAFARVSVDLLNRRLVGLDKGRVWIVSASENLGDISSNHENVPHVP